MLCKQGCRRDSQVRSAGRFLPRRMFRLLAPLALVAASVWGFTAISALAVSRTSRGTAVGPVRPGPVTSAASARPFRPGVVIVGFRRGVSAHRQHLIAAQAGGSASRIAAPGIRLIRVRRGQENKALRRLGRHASSLRFAELDYLMHQTAAAVFPNDPSFGLQWAFQNTGQSVNATTGTSGADENPGSAWSMATGSRSVVIAETDTGVDYNHPDLAANIWSNPGGIGGCDAGTHGYNVLTTTCNPMDDETSYGGHGTHVAGILGAQGNNGTGVTGVNWTTSILPVKWLDSSGSGSTSSLISALNWVLQAKQAGVNVRVVNDSATFVGTAYSQALSDEIDTLGAHDILFVTAAGNTGDNNDDPAVRRYPCGYDRPTEICATASDQYDQKPHWANYGATTVDLAAPGANIYSTLRNGSYGYISGGSMASPQVAGTAALVLSRGYMSAPSLRADILNNVDPLPSLNGLVRTGGRLDVCKALPGCSNSPPPPPGPGPAPPPGPAPAPPPGPAPAPPPGTVPCQQAYACASPRLAARVRISSASARVSGGGTTGVTLTCGQGSGRCSGTLALTVRVRVRHTHRTRLQTVTFAKAGYSIAAGHSAKITLRLAGTGRQLLSHASQHDLRATATARQDSRQITLIPQPKPRRRR